MERVRFSRFEREESIEERFVKGLERMRIWESRHAKDTGEVYVEVEDYDPVLKAHCDRNGPDRRD